MEGALVKETEQDAKQHVWESTSSQGTSMRCINCYAHIGRQDTSSWMRIMSTSCPGKK